MVVPRLIIQSKSCPEAEVFDDLGMTLLDYLSPESLSRLYSKSKESSKNDAALWEAADISKYLQMF